MPNSTPNLDLLKYDTVADKNRYFNINESMNDNWDKIDAFCKNLSDKADNSTSHISNKSNPHSVTKAQVGLGQVDNTSDLNKPVSNAVAELLESDYQSLVEKNAANGYAGLNKEKKVPCKLLSAAKLAYATGEVMTDEEIFNQILNRKHSIFDRSKFTVVGSPTITGDGIVSGFTQSNYLTTSSMSFSYAHNYVIELPFILNSTTAEHHEVIIQDPSNYLNFSLFRPQTGTNNLSVYFGGKGIGISNLVTDKWLLAKITINGINASCSIINLETDENIQTISWTANADYNFTSSLRIGAGLGAFPGSIDLKQFSITVNGVEVFNGNKTGIDTIKPNNYTVVGTPTISSDGVASGFSSGNYLRTNSLTFDSTKSYTIDLPFEYIIPSANKFIYSATTVYTDLSVFNYPDGKVGLYFCGKGTSIPSNYLTEEQRYLLKLHYNNLQLYLELYDVTGNLVVTSKGSPVMYTDAFSKTFNIDIGNDDDFISKERVDLNAFKIYVDGDLVYQPCLKIPYTESFTGSKIADSQYRDRVKDAYEQGYPQRYYTLSDTDFTLPFGEVYGELEQKVRKSDLQEVICIVEQYTFSDANAFCWDLSNGWRIQGARQTVTTTGNMTVPLLKPFANTSYLAFKNYDAGSSSLQMLDGEGSIFSKTETSFVTYNSTSNTTSFDWFAIGKIA